MQNYLMQIKDMMNLDFSSEIVFSNENLINETYISTDMVDMLEDSLYLLPSTDSYIYILNNTSNRKAHTFFLEFFRAILNVQEKFPGKNIKFFLVENNELISFDEYLKSSPCSMEKYSPDFDYILEDFKNSKDTSLKKEIKLKMFFQMLKFISQDSELTSLAKLILND